MRLLLVVGAVLASIGLAEAGNFTWDMKMFYVNGQAHQIIGGQIDPQRVPREYWAQRLQMAKGMGLNTIFSYLYWQDIEEHEGQFDFTGRNDVAAWFKAIQDAGLKAVLRPGPYVCAERDWGGIPGWVSQVPGLKIRSNNQPFLEKTAKYLARVGEQLRTLLITNDGPILMVQIENEYGYVGNDKNYLKALSNLLATSFPGLKQYTNDGSTALKSGFLSGALAVVDGGGSQNGFAKLRSDITDQSSRGPLMNGELWITWFDVWGPKKSHSGNNGNAGDVDFILADGNHFSLFMFHGGTSWAFGAGAQDGLPVQPFTTSYDYGAVLDETGRAASNYAPFRNAIAKKISVPAIPSNPPLQSISDFALTPVANWFDKLPTAVTSSSPKVMEALGQVWGYVLYEHMATQQASGKVVPGNGIRDRVIVYVNGVKQGVIDGIYKNPATVNVNIKSGDKLWLLVENLGRADNGFSDQTKGILGSVTVGGKTLNQWNHYSLPLDSAPSDLSTTSAISVKAIGAPVWYRGTFANTKSGMAADTFLALPGGIKGVVFVNGHNLGRYWAIGPQQHLFLPGAWLNATNEVLVLELEPGTSSRVARGSATRTWGNNPDPDCDNCS